jgi:hypothetical protein
VRSPEALSRKMAFESCVTCIESGGSRERGSEAVGSGKTTGFWGSDF